MSLKTTVANVLAGGAGELGQPDLLRKVVDGIVKLRRHGGRGVEMLPPEVEVHVEVGEGSVELVRRFVDDPAFDREVEAALRNRLVHLREDAMPVRRYVVGAAARTGVRVVETARRGYRLRIEGGDRDGECAGLPPEKRDVLIGRSPWHGDDQQVANDVIVSDNERAVSRRAARLHRVGATFEIEAADQHEALVVVRPDGQRLRPALAASGRVRVRPGDRVELTDGRVAVVTLHLEEVPPA